MHRIRVYVSFGLTIVILLLASACQADATLQSIEALESTPKLTLPPTPELPKNFLFVGNSLSFANLGVAAHLKGLADAATSPIPVEVSTVYVASISLEKLWKRAQSKVINGDFDCIVLQETLQIIWNDGAGRDEFFNNIRQYDNEIRQADAQTVLFMAFISEYDEGITMEDIADAHSQIGEELGIKVAPVGLAAEAARRERPDYDLFEADKVHPNWRGTYLASLVIYATIFEQNPEGITYQPGDIYAGIESLEYKAEKWHMTEDEINFLQRIAWDTVTAYPAARVTR